MSETRPLLDDDDLSRLREALAGADYTSTGIAARIGPDAVDAVRRNDFGAMRGATANADDAAATLIRLFLAGQTEPAAAVAAALAPLPLDVALTAGLVEAYGGGIHASVDLDVYGDGSHDWWVLSDLDVDTRPERTSARPAGPEPRSARTAGLAGAHSSLGRAKPILVKLAPDLTDAAIAEAVEVCLARGVAGVIATTASRKDGCMRSQAR